MILKGNQFDCLAKGVDAMHSFPGNEPHFLPFKQLFQGSSKVLNRLYLWDLSFDK